MSLDPEKNTYPNLSPYSSFGNNPIYYVDNAGKTLGVGGSSKDNKDIAKSDIYELVPAPTPDFDYRSKITVNDAGRVSFDISEAQAIASGDAGVQLLYNLVKSKEHYEYNVKNSAEVVSVPNKAPNAQGKVEQGKISKNSAIAAASKYKLDLTTGKTFDGNGVERGRNLRISSVSKSLFGKNLKGKVPGSSNIPADPTNDAELVITPNDVLLSPGGASPKSRIPLVFHELQELYNRTTLKQSYDKAHSNAIDTEKSFQNGDCRRDTGNEGKAWPPAPSTAPSTATPR